MSYIYLIFAFLLNTGANILLKTGAGRGLYLESYNPLVLFRENIYLIFGFVCFALNALFYFLALKNIPISLAYPIMVTSSLILIGTYAVIFGHENLTTYQIVGYSIIVLGVVITFMNR